MIQTRSLFKVRFFMHVRRAVACCDRVSLGHRSLLVYEPEDRAAATPQGATAPKLASTVRAASAEELSIPDTTLAINSPTPMSQRVVHYEIDAKYDAVKHTIDANEVLTYHNLTGQALDHFPFHLYQNAFQPNATWVREAKIEGSRDTTYDKWDPKEYGSEEIKSIEVVGQGDLTKDLQYIAPDDGNKDDKTVVDLKLAKPIPPNCIRAVQDRIPRSDARDPGPLRMEARFPARRTVVSQSRRVVARSLELPSVSRHHRILRRLRRLRREAHRAAERSHRRQRRQVSDVNNPDGTKTVTYHGDDIHDFAWTVSPRYKVKESTYQAQMGPVKLRILMQPAHWSQVDRHEKHTRESLSNTSKNGMDLILTRR